MEKIFGEIKKPFEENGHRNELLSSSYAGITQIRFKGMISVPRKGTPLTVFYIVKTK